MKQVEINGIWWDTENTTINGKRHADFDTANAYAEKIGRRLPTKEEFEALIYPGYERDEERSGLWFANRKLFLPMEGWRGMSGKIYSGIGLYWSSSASTAAYAWYLLFYGSNANLNNGNRAVGYSVRCVADRKDTWLTKIKRWFINL